ncbi:4207_t:CDS:1 [Paraglomus brasilianum]|uniref:4207_t:CDS:1 n=1 Tax=Paraglomus brasilianum TaxID=144538 RepID=A0A9N9G1C5_9GLOM|nr:4207_t:CDS:1 [Paraglomus brasilianum]
MPRTPRTPRTPLIPPTARVATRSLQTPTTPITPTNSSNDDAPIAARLRPRANKTTEASTPIKQSKAQPTPTKRSRRKVTLDSEAVNSQTINQSHDSDVTTNIEATNEVSVVVIVHKDGNISNDETTLDNKAVDDAVDSTTIQAIESDNVDTSTSVNDVQTVAKSHSDSADVDALNNQVTLVNNESVEEVQIVIDSPIDDQSHDSDSTDGKYTPSHTVNGTTSPETTESHNITTEKDREEGIRNTTESHDASASTVIAAESHNIITEEEIRNKTVNNSKSPETTESAGASVVVTAAKEQGELQEPNTAEFLVPNDIVIPRLLPSELIQQVQSKKEYGNS